MKYRGKDDIIVGRAIDRAEDQARATEVESSRIRAGRVVPTGSH